MKKVIILSTKSRTDIVHSTSKYGGLFLSQYYSPMLEMGDNYQEIYIIDDQEEIKEGDYGIYKEELFKHDGSKGMRLNQVKVIATTDSNLQLPLINKEFIQLYVEKQGKIEEVNMKIDYSELSDRTKAIVTLKEVDDVKVAGDGGIAEQLAQKKYSNVIANASTPEVAKGFMQQRMGYYKGVIDGVQYQKKQSYSREEVIEIIYKSSYVLAYGDSTKHDADKWISQNLKK